MLNSLNHNIITRPDGKKKKKVKKENPEKNMSTFSLLQYLLAVPAMSI